MTETEINYYDYDPVIFLRCHSKNDSVTERADIKTQVWQVCYEPKRDPKKVATCGGNRVCIIDIETAEVDQRYNGENTETFYALAWNKVTIDGKKRCILAVGGALNTIYFLHPYEQRKLAQFTIGNRKSTAIFSLLFHPEQKNILFCAMKKGGVKIIRADVNNIAINILGTFSHAGEITRLALYDSMLLAATDLGLCGWSMEAEDVHDIEAIPMLKFRLVKSSSVKHSEGFYLVDSVEVLGDGFIATKFEGDNFIYIWNMRQANHSPHSDVVDIFPCYKLNWKNTDNCYMEISANYDMGLLSCGDDEGAIWLYDINCIKNSDPGNEIKILQPVEILPWPIVNDVHLVKSRKLDLDRHDIVITKAAIHPNALHIVAITNNNTVCIWKRVYS